jgi:hypothetical protein
MAIDFWRRRLCVSLHEDELLRAHEDEAQHQGAEFYRPARAIIAGFLRRYARSRVRLAVLVNGLFTRQVVSAKPQ